MAFRLVILSFVLDGNLSILQQEETVICTSKLLAPERRISSVNLLFYLSFVYTKKA